MVSEWTQQIGLVLLTKRLIETGSKESRDDSQPPPEGHFDEINPLPMNYPAGFQAVELPNR